MLPWYKQREIARSVVENVWTAIRASTGPGKTWLLARLVHWWMGTRKNGVVITTANTWLQVKSQLWREIRSAHQQSRERLPGSPGIVEYSLGPKWYALGISSNAAETVAGYHSTVGLDVEAMLADPLQNPDSFELDEATVEMLKGLQEEGEPVLVIIDEASKIEKELWDAFLGLLTNPGSRLVASGNPTRTEGRFHGIFHPPPGEEDSWPWARFHISAFDAPAEIISREWIEQLRKLCGPDPEKHPLWQVRVLGEFPDSADNSLFPLWLLEQASEGCALAAPHGRHMGVDIARSDHGDACVAILNVDGRIASVDVWRPAKLDHAAMVTTARKILSLMEAWGVEPEDCHLDVSGGWGWGPHDDLHDWGFPVDGVNFGAGAEGDWEWLLGDAIACTNRRQELHWIGRGLLARRFASIPDPSKPGGARYGPLWADLLGVHYDYTKAEGLWIESKKDYKKRVGRSPDYGDAFLLSLARSSAATVSVSMA